MPAISELDELIRSMKPTLVDGEYVYVTLDAPDLTLPMTAMVREPEGVSYVVERSEADRRGLAYEYVAAWITLLVHSSLDAVGLTAVVSTAVAAAGISCNVVAGRFHDHLLVPHDRGAETVALLQRLASSR
jgi:uncharacterized protein